MKNVVARIAQSGAAVIAIAAVGLAIWEGLENRRHNRLTVIPKIDSVRDFDMLAQTFRFSLLSNGLGPAVVQNLCFYVDGEKFFDKDSDSQYPWSEAYKLFRGRYLNIWDFDYKTGQYLIPGERYDLLRGELREGAERSDDFRDQADRINVVIRYCSVYGDQCASEQLGVTALDEASCQ